MPADKGFHDHVMELLSDFPGVTSRPMFGGYGIFQYGDMFALISGATLYFKVDGSNRKDYEEAGGERFKPMPYYSVPGDVMEDGEQFRRWADRSITIGHATARKKKK